LICYIYIEEQQLIVEAIVVKCNTSFALLSKIIFTVFAANVETRLMLCIYLTVIYFYFVNTYKGTLHITTKLCNACTGSRPSHGGRGGRCCRGCNQEEGQELELELSELEMQDLEVPELEVSELEVQKLEVPELDVKELEKKLQKKDR
jgi:hypothetical protein